MKILYITTIGSTMDFFDSFIKKMISEGNEVHIATNQSISMVSKQFYEIGCEIFPISCSRSPLCLGNLRAVKEIKDIVEKNDYDIVHCHTPIAAACTRIACINARKKGTRVIYTAHGFHFYKGAPMKNWLLYYPIEKICGRLTDVLITINQEDYDIATRKIGAKKVAYIPGVGIDVDKIKNLKIDENAKKNELNIENGKKVLLSIGELNTNKNHETVIRAIKHIENIHYLIAGEGGLREYLKDVIEELGLEDRVSLLGYRNDVLELCAMSDVFVSASIREGLPVSVLEAMASSLPCVVTKIRGNSDLIDNNGGSYFEPGNISDCKRAIEEVLNGDLAFMGNYNSNKVSLFGNQNVFKQVQEIYKNL